MVAPAGTDRDCHRLAYRSKKPGPFGALRRPVAPIAGDRTVSPRSLGLEYVRSTLILSEAGFVPLDALSQAAKSVPNRYAGNC